MCGITEAARAGFCSAQMLMCIKQIAGVPFFNCSGCCNVTHKSSLPEHPVEIQWERDRKVWPPHARPRFSLHQPRVCSQTQHPSQCTTAQHPKRGEEGWHINEMVLFSVVTKKAWTRLVCWHVHIVLHCSSFLLFSSILEYLHNCHKSL